MVETNNTAKYDWSNWVILSIIASFVASVFITINFVDYFDSFYLYRNTVEELELIYSVIPTSSIFLMIIGYIMLIMYNPITRFKGSSLKIDQYDYNGINYTIRKYDVSVLKLVLSYIIFTLGVSFGIISFFTQVNYYKLIESDPLYNTTIIDLVAGISNALAIIFCLFLIVSIIVQKEKQKAFNSYKNSF
jgi:hypothetical protein